MKNSFRSTLFDDLQNLSGTNTLLFIGVLFENDLIAYAMDYARRALLSTSSQSVPSIDSQKDYYWYRVNGKSFGITNKPTISLSSPQYLDMTESADKLSFSLT